MLWLGMEGHELSGAHCQLAVQTFPSRRALVLPEGVFKGELRVLLVATSPLSMLIPRAVWSLMLFL